MTLILANSKLTSSCKIFELQLNTIETKYIIKIKYRAARNDGISIDDTNFERANKLNYLETR